MSENLTRKYQKIFAKNAGNQGKTIFGSTAQGQTQYSDDLDTMQSEAYENGFADAVVSKKAPVMQDFNTVENVTTRQLAYLFQKGIPEWNSETTYFKGNIVLNIESDVPVLYYSLINNNINNELTDTASWSKMFDNSSEGAQVVGQIIQVLCSSNYIPNGCLPCDGTEYTKTQFPDLWNNYLTATTPLLQTCTYEEYQTSITNNGFCEKFAIDNINNKFKVPTLNNIMYQNTDTTLPIVGNGKTISVTDGITNVGLYISSKANTVASRPGLYETDLGTNDTAIGFYMHDKSIGFSEDETASCLIAKNKINASLRFFVVVANGEINQSQMDWSAWAASLQTKANTNLSNIDTTAKETITNLSTPSTRYIEIALTPDTGFNYTCPANGYITIGAESSSSGGAVQVLNKTNGLGNQGTRNGLAYIGCSIPVAKGDVVELYYYNCNSYYARFIYSIGN